ncbi:Short-chain dehydrogenase/reductase SDR [Trinorchestia longiramus]|nr:Short-chain dehydrogenase/reductase SDR [Trinorchestia longiramus]
MVDVRFAITLLGQSVCVLGQSACVLGQSACVLGQSVCVLGQSVCVLGQSVWVLGQSVYVLGQSVCVLGHTIMSEIIRGLVTLLQVLLLLIKLVYLYLEAVFTFFFPTAKKCVRGKIVLVTGAGHGIGKELSLQLGRLRATVVCCDINENWNSNTVKEVKAEGGSAFGYQCDVSDENNVKDVMGKVRTEVGDIDILINNAGIMPCKPFLKHSQAEVDKLFSINVMAHFYTVRYWLPVFMNRGSGHIVALSSAAGLVGSRNLVPYCSTKFAVKGFMDGLRQELRYNSAPSGIQLTVVHPFIIDTGLAHKPAIRFKLLNPITPPAEAATVILDSMRRNEYMVHIPYRDCVLFKIGMAVPQTVRQALEDFVSASCDEHDN